MKTFKLEMTITTDNSDFDEFVIDEFVKDLIENSNELKVVKITAREN